MAIFNSYVSLPEGISFLTFPTLSLFREFWHFLPDSVKRIGEGRSWKKKSSEHLTSGERWCFFTGWWFGTWILLFRRFGIIIPTDELIFFRGVGIPPTSLELHPLSSSYTLEHFYNPLQLDQLAISLGWIMGTYHNPHEVQICMAQNRINFPKSDGVLCEPCQNGRVKNGVKRIACGQRQPMTTYVWMVEAL